VLGCFVGAEGLPERINAQFLRMLAFLRYLAPIALIDETLRDVPVLARNSA
jgi:hypothetical protein